MWGKHPKCKGSLWGAAGPGLQGNAYSGRCRKQMTLDGGDEQDSGATAVLRRGRGGAEQVMRKSQREVRTLDISRR